MSPVVWAELCCFPVRRSDSSSFEVSQQRCSELEEQVEQQQKVIRYLQAQLESSKGAAPHQHLQAEVQQLKQQLAVLQLGAGAGGAASALQQQVLLLQVGRKGRWRLSSRTIASWLTWCWPSPSISSSGVLAHAMRVHQHMTGEELLGVLTEQWSCAAPAGGE